MSTMGRIRSGLLGGAAVAAEEGRGVADASLLALVDRLSSILDRSDISELEVSSGGTTLVLRKADGVTGVSAIPIVGSGRPSTPADGAGRSGDAHAYTPTVAEPASLAAPVPHAVIAPLTGIFYASPSPTAPPFVAVGQEIVAGQVIGLIEAMKLFNEIKSDASGRISRILVDNGALVKAKQTLIEVVPL